MALLPGQIQDIASSSDFNSQLAAMTTEGVKCFVVDETSSEVLFASDSGLGGAKILERGLSDKDLCINYSYILLV